MKIETQKTIIKLSKFKITLLILASFGFVSIGFWLWMFGGANINIDTLLTKVAGSLSIIFFGMTGIYGFVKIFDSKPGLIISQYGIMDNSNIIGDHFIKCIDIVSFDIIQVKSTKFLLIFVKNPNKYTDQVNRFKRFLMKTNEKMYGTPFIISSNSLSCNFDELIKIIDEKIKKSDE
ncbi:STM3941 family protein [uncultured Tenacibaculum sp.]|uniref:STM3941 family protein n=1 Tax=uncultured Tenacibaculum sp. TaxID=174713 RepID=UPI0026186C7A|nr:STM3941 family protein [uncultured Tenacibaculum sp.]